MTPNQSQFIKWLINNGTKLNKVTIHRFEDGHQGIIAENDINENETIAAIPYKILITQDSIRNGPYKKLIQKNHQLFNELLNQDADLNLLVFFVILEKLKNQNSFYSSYFKVCEDIQNMFSWSKEQFNTLQDEEIQNKFLKMQIGLQKNYSLFQTLFNENKTLPQISYELYLESYQFVMTRCYAGGKDSHLNSTSLVPFGDSMNHSHSQQTSYFLVCPTLEKNNNTDYIKKSQLINLSLIGLEFIQNENNEDFDENFTWIQQYKNQTYLAIYAQQKIKKGEEIFNFFGEKDNSFLLLWYGFCYKDNIYDKVRFYINIQQPQYIKFYTKKSGIQNYKKIKLTRFELNYGQLLIHIKILDLLEEGYQYYKNLLDQLIKHYENILVQLINSDVNLHFQLEFYKGKINVLQDQNSLLKDLFDNKSL